VNRTTTSIWGREQEKFSARDLVLYGWRVLEHENLPRYSRFLASFADDGSQLSMIVEGFQAELKKQGGDGS
jgi:hypothetical protein